MKAGIYFTESGPILALTSHDSLIDDALVEKLAARGITKFIVYELGLDLIQEHYSHHFNEIMDNVDKTYDLRILDEDGHHIFGKFSMYELGKPTLFESGHHEHQAWPMSWEAYHKAG